MSGPFEELQRLAASYDVQTVYRDVHGQHQSASPEVMLGLLNSLGVSLRSLHDVTDALCQRKAQWASRLIEPVTVAWGGIVGEIKLRLPGCNSASVAEFSCKLEAGETVNWTSELRPVVGNNETTNQAVKLWSATYRYVPLPLGYHDLRVEVAGFTGQSLVISAPSTTFSSGMQGKRRWGLFAPVYALHSEQCWGAGNLTDLETLWQWTTKVGGDVVATLPLLAAFLDDPCDYSPYTPASRLFWNDFYIDIRRVEELQRSQRAQQLLESSGFMIELESLRREPWVDYHRQAKLQRQVLSELSRVCFAHDDARRASMEKFVRERPELSEYAAFRACMERQQQGWSTWPSHQRDGQLYANDYDEDARRYHIYVQWIVQQQLDHLIATSKESGAGLYLDLPLGVHREGFDTWRQRDQFALKASGGAPPDTFFTKGQNWGFPPPHPQRMREGGYQHFIKVLRHHFANCGILRIDHVMQLHRLYWIPQGMDAKDGAYVRYAADELYAIICLESHRHHCAVVGEDLGTVPHSVKDAMKRHHVRRMYVVQYETNADQEPPVAAIDSLCVASVNTHDMANFAAYLDANDLDLLFSLGLFDEEGIAHEKTIRHRNLDALFRWVERRESCTGFRHHEKSKIEMSPATGSTSKASKLSTRFAPDDVTTALNGVYELLASSPAELMLVNIEDLWLEKEPQNIPGTGSERPNWRRKMRYSIEEIVRSIALAERLKHISKLRQQGP